jgi:uncharacterized membrane protein
MASEFYQYNGQIYEYKNTEKQLKEKKASETKIILLTLTVVALAIICVSLNLIINKTAKENSVIQGDFVYNSVADDQV